MQRPNFFDPPWIDFFTKPCPYFIKQLTTFPQFSRLPRELQLMIWATVVPERRVIQLIGPDSAQTSLPPGTPPASFRLCIRFSIPPILSTCFDARAAGLKIYEKAFVSYLQRPVYFDFDRDYLELDVRTIEYFAGMSEDRDTPLLEPLKVKSLALMNDRPLRAQDVVFYCKLFSRLERLAISEPGPSTFPSPRLALYVQNSVPTVPHTFLPGQNSFRHNWDKLRAPIMKRISYVRPALAQWEPPLLIIGTDAQWEQHSKNAADIAPAWGGVDPNSMEWESTVVIPSLEYIPRLGTVSPRDGVVSIGKNRLRTGAGFADSDEREHHDTKSLLFYRNPVPTDDTLVYFDDEL
ncbi:hypothetical protein BUE80_DR005388 [Diplocarpon rosae]|nr:hypothetical protein BUE80_DR005388 [Diplocarpon rosae]